MTTEERAKNMDKTYCPLHAHSYYSLLDGLCSPDKLIDRCLELGLPGCALTDHGNLAGMKIFYDAAKKKGIKPVIGVELYQCEDHPSIRTGDNNKRYHLIVLAKNDDGIKDLMSMISESNRSDYFYRKPRLNLETIEPFARNGNLIFLSACIGGELPFNLFSDFKEAAKVSGHGDNLDKVRQFLKPNWIQVGKEIVEKFVNVVGKDNYYIELQDEGMDIQTVATECLREIGKKCGIRTVATIDAHYSGPDEAEDQRLLLYSQLHTTREEQQRKKEQGVDIMDFMISDNYYIPSYEEMRKKFTEEELQTTIDIVDRIEYSSFDHNPFLPIFTNEESTELRMNSDEYLKHICIEGAKQKLADLPKNEKKLYWERLQKELFVIQEAKLSDYFLIVWDACKFVDNNGGPRGKGRGSGAGSLVNYLTSITGIDPIEYGLYFERFYNVSRNIPAHFNVGGIDFMSWLSENFEELRTRNIPEERKEVSKHLAKRIQKCNIHFTDHMKWEVKWIDENNPKMWLYLNDMIKLKPDKNLSNSHLAFGLGITIKEREELDDDKRVDINKGHTSLPDIDVDIGVEFRSEVIRYLKNRWGESHVAQMITFNRLQGRAALKEVFRAQQDTARHLMKVKAIKEGKNPDDIAISPHDLCNEITKHIPDEAAIADDLQQAREEHGDDYGILEWSIHHIDQVQNSYEWYKPLFDQAMRIEGTKKSQSRHAAGVVIADRPIADFTPLTYDARSKDRVVGLEMNSAEDIGAVKFDFLGVVALDKLWKAQDLINGRTSK